jgi:NitT/TauT family transport system substrate-binding protein
MKPIVSGTARRWFAGLLMLAVSSATLVSAQEESAQLKLRLGDVSMNKLPFILAYDKGIYKKHGIDIIPKFTQGSVDVIRKSGIIVPEEFILQEDEFTELCICGTAPSIVGLTTEAGRWDPVFLGSTHLQARWRIIGKPEINSPEQLKGKRIGYSGVGAVTHFYALSFAIMMGWDPKMDWSMMGDALGVDALTKGYVDAIIAPELHGTMAIDAGFKVIADFQDYDLPVAGSGFAVNRQWLKNNDELARRFIKAAVEALALMKTDKDSTFETMGKWYQMSDPEIMEMFYDEASKVPMKPYPAVDGIRRVMELYDSHEMRKYKLEHFYDASYVKELDDNGFIDSLYKKN